MSRLLTILAFSLVGTATFAQGGFAKNYTFQTTPMGYYESGRTHITSDGNYIMTGSIITGIETVTSYLIKTDSDGNVLWSKTYNVGSGGYALAEVAGGGYVIASAELVSIYWEYDVSLTRVDAAGNPLWSKSYGEGTGGPDTNSTVSSYANDVLQTTDGGFMIIGYTQNYGAGGGDVYLLKTDASGSLQWTRTYGGSSREEGKAIRKTTDGGYIIVGSTRSFGTSFRDDVYMLKIDANGNVLWSKKYSISGRDYEYGTSVELTNDGGYVIVGFDGDRWGNTENLFLIKTDGSGNPDWAKKYVWGNSRGYGVKQTLDGGYIITGASDGPGAAASATYLIKTDSAGTVDWSFLYNDTIAWQGNSVEMSGAGGYLVGAGPISIIKTDGSGIASCQPYATNTSATDIVIIASSPSTLVSSGGSVFVYNPSAANSPVTDTSYCRGVGIAEIQQDNRINIHPNPFSTSTTLQITNDELRMTNFEVRLYDFSGKLVRVETGLSAGSVTLERGGLPGGMYFVVVEAEDGVLARQKVIIR